LAQTTIDVGAYSDALIVLGTAGIVVPMVRRWGLNPVLGYLGAGALLGPLGLGSLADRIPTLHWLTITDARNVSGIAELGIVFLLFLIGLEMHPQRLWRLRRLLFGLGTSQVVITGLLLSAVMWLLGFAWPAAIAVGFGYALSSTAFVMQLLHERGETMSEHGQGAFAILLLQDLAIVPLLALVPVLAGGVSADGASVLPQLGVGALMLLILFAFGRYLVPAVLGVAARHRNTEAFGVIAVLSVLFAAWTMQIAGLSMALGAFVMGMLLSGSGFIHQIEAEIAPFKGILLSLFFVSIGMSMDLAFLAREALWIGGVVTMLLMLKAALILGLARLFGLPLGAAVRAAFLLAQAGEFGFVLLAAAHAEAVLRDETYQASLLVISVSMAATPFLARLGDRLAERLQPDDERHHMLPGPTAEAHDRHVVVAGFGRVGRNVAFMLEEAGVPYVALDSDPKRVTLGRREGRPVFFGEPTDPRVLERAGVGRACVVVLTLNDTNATEQACGTIRSFYPEVPLVVRARDLGARDRLLAAGVNHAIPETIELSISLGDAVLRRVGASQETLEAVHAIVQQDNFANLRLGAIRERMASVGKAEA
jgi:glutathione-regulated potassium-efflux system protein KefB